MIPKGLKVFKTEEEAKKYAEHYGLEYKMRNLCGEIDYMVWIY